MAGGKASPRQKMINLMYLVFIAMLAMNMSKEVLSAFGFMKERLIENNVSVTKKNEAAYANLATKASEQAAKFSVLNEQAVKIKELSAGFYTYLGDLKTMMAADVDDKKDYQSMDKTAFLDDYFFKGDKFTEKGQEFLDRINGYKTGVISALGSGNDALVASVNNRFNTEDIENRDGKMIRWLEYRYESFPLIASLTNITQIQSDIKNTENDIVSSLLGGKLEESLSLSNYKGIVSLDKNAYFAGEKVTGKVVLGRYDATMVPDKVVLNGRDYKNIQSGQVIIDMPAGNVGNHKIKGTISFTQNGELVPVEFESSYSVISQPDEAVISADKMNVVYRGLDNPISISLPGVGDKDIVATAPGLEKVGKGKYRMRPKGGDFVTINVTGKLSSGKTISTPKKFRIKDIPAAMASVRGEYGTVRMPKSSLARTSISAGLPDFVFDLKLKVTGFKVKVPGQITVVVNGGQFSAQAKKVLSKARRGDMIVIFDIKAAIIGNSSYKLKKVLPVNIELTN